MEDNKLQHRKQDHVAMIGDLVSCLHNRDHQTFDMRFGDVVEKVDSDYWVAPCNKDKEITLVYSCIIVLPASTPFDDLLRDGIQNGEKASVK